MKRQIFSGQKIENTKKEPNGNTRIPEVFKKDELNRQKEENWGEKYWNLIQVNRNHSNFPNFVERQKNYKLRKLRNP